MQGGNLEKPNLHNTTILYFGNGIVTVGWKRIRSMAVPLKLSGAKYSRSLLRGPVPIGVPAVCHWLPSSTVVPPTVKLDVPCERQV